MTFNVKTNYLTTERSNLQALAFAITRGELLGSSIANRPVIVNPTPVMTMPDGRQRTQAPAPAAAPAGPVIYGELGPAPMSPRDVMTEQGYPPQGTASQVFNKTPTTGRLLVLIRYNQPNVEYEQQLSAAVGTVLQRKADASFSVIAVSPASGAPAQLARLQEEAARNSESVKRALVQLGLAPSRITVASTQTQDAEMAEVHVYVR